jgi:HEAT repeat protein
MSRDRGSLVRIVGSDSPLELRQRVISRLGNGDLMPPADLMQLYQKEQNKDLRLTMVRALGAMGAVDQLVQVVKTEKEPTVRLQAIRSLGNAKSERSSQTLIDLYGSEQDKDARKAVISALSNQGNADGLVAIARKETSNDLKLDIVRRLSEMASKNKVAMDYLMELVK